MLEVELDDGRQEIIRVPVPSSYDSDGDLMGPRLPTFESESALLIWLKKNTRLPVPTVKHLVYRSANEPHTFCVMEKIPGTTMERFGDFSPQVQVSTAHITYSRLSY